MHKIHFLNGVEEHEKLRSRLNKKIKEKGKNYLSTGSGSGSSGPNPHPHSSQAYTIPIPISSGKLLLAPSSARIVPIASNLCETPAKVVSLSPPKLYLHSLPFGDILPAEPAASP